MSITYQQKRQILSYMSQRSHWANIFDMDFFMDERRKWHTSRSQHDITLSSSPDKKSFQAVDEKQGGGSISLSLLENGAIAVSDESSRSAQVGKTGIRSAFDRQDRSEALPEIHDIASANEIGMGSESARLIAIPELAAYIRFYDDKTKAVFLENWGKKVTFGPPLHDRDLSLHPGRFFHVVSFDLDTAAQWGLTPYGALNGTKLIVSKDLFIEPDLRTFNELDPEKAAEYLSFLLRDEWDDSFKGPWQWRPKKIKNVGDITHLQKQWADSTEFSGYFIGLPKQFFVETTDNGFRLATSLDNREAIWSQTALLSEAAGGALDTVQTVTPKLSPGIILHLLNKGDTLADHRGRAWKCVVLEAKGTAEIAKNARDIGRTNFGLTGYHFASLNFDDHSCLIAMDAEIHDRVSHAYEATVQLLHMIKSGTRNKAQMEKLLEAGADLRLVKPLDAQAGRTLANEMKDAENFEMLADLQEQGDGIHDLTFTPPEAEPDHQGPA